MSQRALLRCSGRLFGPPRDADINGIVGSAMAKQLTLDHVRQYRRDGFLLVKDFFTPAALDLYANDLRRASQLRGDSLLPNADECQNSVEINVRSKEKKQIDELEKAGKPVPEELRKKRPKPKYANQRMTLKYKNERAFVRGYKAALDKRRKIAASRGYRVPELDVEAEMRRQDEARKRRKERIQRGEGSEADVAKEEEANAQEQRAKAGGEPGPDDVCGYDERSGEYLSRAEMDARAKEYCESPAFRERIDKQMHITEVNRFFSQMGQAWVHLWHGDDPLRATLSGPVGAALARTACSLSGMSKARLFTDQGTVKKRWGNTHPVHCTAPFVDFIDMRAVAATVVLPPSPMDRKRGAVVALPGSHHILRRISDDGRDVTLFTSMPASWDVAEWMRAIPELKTIEPVEVEAPVGSVLFTHTHFGFAQQPNYTNDEVLTHTLFLMPDGVTYTGAKQTWMTTSRDGPLRDYVPGQPLRDEATFPLLYDSLAAG